ncbi:MAG: B12-binding domain-containing radical SAM protein [Anaerolineales bacterium]|nr:B12-binding domain-containing radical SAM protein [Anaerolineales bacterium]
MKIAFYVPPIPDDNTVPLLGPLYLIAALERNGFEGRLFDARIDRFAFRKLLAFRPEVVGISAVTAGYLGGLRAARKIKEIFPNVPVVFGGPHPSSLPEQVAADPAVDYVLIGESETTIVDLCQRLREQAITPASLREVKSLAFKAGEEIVVTERLTAPENLDDLPMPAFHRMDLETYFAGTQAHGLFRRGKRILTMMSTRGCPYGCTFCCRVMGKTIRRRSVESVMAEVEFLTRTFGIDELYFEDDNFTAQRERALEILDRLAVFKPPLYLKFANGIRADRVDREILKAMKRARVDSLSFGIESGCEATLAQMHKNLRLELARENVLLAKSLGFLVGANCIIGYPGETKEDIAKSLEFFFGLPLDSMAIVNLVPFPGTEVRSICERNGYLTEAAKNWDNYFFSLNNPIPLIETPQLSGDELIRCVRGAYRRMYLRPKWISRALMRLTPRQMVIGAATLLGMRGGKAPPDPTDVK